MGLFDNSTNTQYGGSNPTNYGGAGGSDWDELNRTGQQAAQTYSNPFSTDWNDLWQTSQLARQPFAYYTAPNGSRVPVVNTTLPQPKPKADYSGYIVAGAGLLLLALLLKNNR